MKKSFLTMAMAGLLSLCCTAQEATRIFTDIEGNAVEDRIMKYDFQKEEVLLEKRGKMPFAKFSPEDREYILQWNQVNGFQATMRFKMEVEKSNWARMKYEQNITPFYMDAIQIPGKRAPIHNIIMLEDYEEYNAVYMEAQGFQLKMRNQNDFPLENLTVESRIYYEQEQYVTSDSVFESGNNDFSDTVVSNKVRFLSETVPQIIPQEEVFLHSECAILADHQIERTSTAGDSNNENDDSDNDDDDSSTESIDGFGDWDDHARRKKGKMIGVWFRVGIKGIDGEMVWRDITSPSSLPNKVSWEPPYFGEEEEK